MTIHAVIWDLGGVLVRTEDRTPRTQAAARFGLTYEQLEDLVFNDEVATQAQLGEISGQALWEHAARKLNLSPEERSWLAEAFFAGDVLDPVLIDFTRSLRPSYKTGVISNAWAELPRLMEHWQILDAFDHITGSGDVGVMKPDPRIYRLSLHGLGVEPQEAVFIDDNPANVEGARMVGLHAVRFQSREQVLSEIVKLLEG
jgi:epoxide hydrolase-like predicted phosphatase